MKKLVSRLSITIYKILEHLDGEKGPKIVPYPQAQRMKMVALRHIY